MKLEIVDFIIIIAFLVVSLAIGIIVSKSSSKDSSSFFLSSRNMPWWLLGVSMVATTFAADTPNLVADIVRKNGVSGNWEWWAFLLTGMVTVFFYAKLWRRSGITTDLEFYELRYDGKSAAFLRGFRALYLGVVFNVIIMGTVCLAAIKIGHVMFDFSAAKSLIIASVVTLAYSLLGGLKSVLITDFVQFIVAMVGSIWATYYIVNLPQINGMANLISHPNVASKLRLLPDFSNTDLVMGIFLIPLAVQWWSTWYPGAEPGGGGYVAQRMLAAKDEKNAAWAVLFFNLAHYALRPWPWIIIALASLIIYPDVNALAQAFPNLDPRFVKDDLSYPAMLTFLPAGLLGLVVTSLVAAFMSTISTHLNWGSSYIVNDFYTRFINKEATEQNKVAVGRVSMIIMMVLAGLLALVLEQAKDAFDLVIQIGAGSGLLFILRWFWHRINPWSEITAMAVSFIIAITLFIDTRYEFGLFGTLANYKKMCLNVLVTSIAWLLVTYFTKPSSTETLNTFNEAIFGKESKFHNFPAKIIGFFMGVCGVYSLLFATGKLLYGQHTVGFILLLSFLLCTFGLFLLRKKLF
jgi:Na+/proline symporter